MARTRYTEDESALVHRLFREGKSQNACGKLTGLHSDALQKIAREHGFSWNVASNVAAATQTRLAKIAAVKTQLAADQLEDAKRLRTQLFTAGTYGQFGGKDNTWSDVWMERPPSADQLKIQQAVASATANALRLLDSEAGQDRNTINLIVSTARKLGLDKVDGE